MQVPSPQPIIRNPRIADNSRTLPGARKQVTRCGAFVKIPHAISMRRFLKFIARVCAGLVCRERHGCTPRANPLRHYGEGIWRYPNIIVMTGKDEERPRKPLPVEITRWLNRHPRDFERFIVDTPGDITRKLTPPHKEEKPK